MSNWWALGRGYPELSGTWLWVDLGHGKYWLVCDSLIKMFGWGGGHLHRKSVLQGKSLSISNNSIALDGAVSALVSEVTNAGVSK